MKFIIFALLFGAVGGPRDRVHRAGACAAAQAAYGRCERYLLRNNKLESNISAIIQLWLVGVIECIGQEHAQRPKLLTEGVPNPWHNDTHFTHCSTDAERQRIGVSESGAATSNQPMHFNMHPSASHRRCSGAKAATARQVDEACKAAGNESLI